MTLKLYHAFLFFNVETFYSIYNYSNDDSETISLATKLILKGALIGLLP